MYLDLLLSSYLMVLFFTTFSAVVLSHFFTSFGFYFYSFSPSLLGVIHCFYSMPIHSASQVKLSESKANHYFNPTRDFKDFRTLLSIPSQF